MPAPTLLRISEPSPAKRPPPRGFALFALGFRPFYLLAAMHAAVAMILWMGAIEGVGWKGAGDPLAWHQHEMVFGFALAVIAGFLLTAGRVWTGLPTPEGWPLAMIALHWLAARVLLYTGPATAAAWIDGAFPFVLAAVMARILIASRSRRNYFAIALLSVLGLANIGYHLEQAGMLALPPGASMRASLYLIVLMVVMIGGRVVPSFTASALPMAGVKVRNPRLDWGALAFTLAAFAGAVIEAPAPVVAPAAFAAALLHAARQWQWAPRATLQRPILWILHVSHAWIPVGLALLGAASLGWVAPDAAPHAFGAGAVGGMIIGMITRTALGHTARPLRAGWPETAAYVIVQLAALTRVAAAFAAGSAWTALMWSAGHLWALGFALYFVVYLPRLIRPRLDGKPG